MFVRGLFMAAAAMAVAIVVPQFLNANHFDWNDNAYASVVTALLVLHLIW